MRIFSLKAAIKNLGFQSRLFFLAFIMDENLAGKISVVDYGNANEKERNQMVFHQIADLERKRTGELNR